MSKPTQNSILLLAKNGTNSINSYKTATKLILSSNSFKLLRCQTRLNKLAKPFRIMM
jgi:hypothetical protein